MTIMCLTLYQRPIGATALDRVINRAPQAMRIEPALDQIILCSFTHCRQGQFLVVSTTNDDDRRVAPRLLYPPERFQTLGVRQGEIGNDDVEQTSSKLA